MNSELIKILERCIDTLDGVRLAGVDQNPKGVFDDLSWVLSEMKRRNSMLAEQMVEAGLSKYSEGGAMGLSDYERREVVMDIIDAALSPLGIQLK